MVNRTGRRRRARRLLLAGLDEALLGVERLQHGRSGVQQLHGGALVGDRGLEQGVLLLAVLKFF